MFTGVVPSSFRILRQILDRIDSVENGEVIYNFLRFFINCKN